MMIVPSLNPIIASRLCFSAPLHFPVFSAAPWAFEPFTPVNHNYGGCHPSESLSWRTSSSMHMKSHGNCSWTSRASVIKNAKLHYAARAKVINDKGQAEKNCIRKADHYSARTKRHQHCWPSSHWIYISSNTAGHCGVGMYCICCSSTAPSNSELLLNTNYLIIWTWNLYECPEAWLYYEILVLRLHLHVQSHFCLRKKHKFAQDQTDLQHTAGPEDLRAALKSLAVEICEPDLELCRSLKAEQDTDMCIFL